MIKISVCFSCIHYSFENKNCPEHSQGEIREVKDCGNEIEFEDSFKRSIETKHQF